MSIITYYTPRVCPFIYPTTKPNFLEIYFCNWSHNCLGYHIWAHTIIKKCISNALPLVKFSRYDTSKRLGRDISTFPIPCSPKYPCACSCISASWNFSKTLKTYFVPVSVPTMNARRPQPYLADKLRNWSTMSLEFETEIYILSVSLSISLVAWR